MERPLYPKHLTFNCLIIKIFFNLKAYEVSVVRYKFVFLMVLFLLCASCFPKTGLAESEPAKKVSGFVEFNLYPYDTRDVTVYTINTLLNLLLGFNYFGFVNYFSPINSSTNEELEGFYTEHNLNWKLPHNLPFQLAAQWAIASGPSSDTLRFGFGWFVSATPLVATIFQQLNLFYRLDIFPAQIEALPGFNWQLQHVYGLQILPELLDNRVYVGGFADHDLGPNGSTFVTETQLGVRLIDQFHLIAEYRHDEFLPEEDGVGFGGEYKVRF